MAVSSTFTAQLVAETRALMSSPLPPEAALVARQCLLDWTGCAIAGSHDAVVTCLLAEALERGAGPHALLGRRERLSLLDAATVNGAASHVLDFDDSLSAMGGHASVAIVPALLALHERLPEAGERFIAALVAGHQIAGLLGRRLGNAPYLRGFHSTATLGAMAAACACAHFMELDEARTVTALSIASSQAAGLKAMFGTMGKSFQVGRAAATGLLSARLASLDFDAPAEPLDHPQGFAVAHGASLGESAETAALTGDYHIRDSLFKFNAACFGVQAPVAAASALVRKHGLMAQDIASVRVAVAPGLAGVCNIDRPATGLEAKFSLKATAAMTLLNIDLGSLESFSDSLIRSDPVIAMMERVEVAFDLRHSRGEACVTVRTHDHRAVTAEWNSTVPNADLEDQGERVRAKFLALVVPHIGTHRAEQLGAVISAPDFDLGAYRVLAC